MFPNIDLSHKSASAIQRNSDPDAVFVVTGANRGIGLQFVKSLSERTAGTIVACYRNPDTANKLKELAASSPRKLVLQQLDLENQASIECAGKAISQQFGRVDVLLNVAGILGDGHTTAGPERSLAKIDRDWFEKTVSVNTIGPVMWAQQLAPLMISRRSRKQTDHQRPTAVMAALSARVGCISDNSLGGWYTYRTSKAALNMAVRTMALEWKRHGCWALSLHPGTTDTDLSKPFQKNVKPESLFPVEFTAQRLLDVMDAAEEEHSGGLYDWAGQALSF